MSTTTEAQRARYARRVWADQHIGATVTPETAHTPLSMHGPEQEPRPITVVWSSYGHRFMDDGGESTESCLTCGAMYELIHDDLIGNPSHGAYVAANGDEPMQCTHDTSMVHGYAGEIDGDPHPDCNCLLCA